jgi:O-antigen/teichoic acid export membrane protein
MAADQRRAALWILGTTVAAEIALVAALIPRFGLAGAAAGAAGSSLLAAAWGAALLRASLGLRPLATLARSLAAAAVVAAALWWWSPAAKLVPVALAVVLGSAAYFVLLWALREFSTDDIASVRKAAGR